LLRGFPAAAVACAFYFPLPGSLCTFGGPSLIADAEPAAAAEPGLWSFVIIQ
jgi:hypothetical protein